MAGDVVLRTNLNQLPATTVGNIYYETQSINMRDGCGPSVGWTQLRCRIDDTNRYNWVRAMVGRVLVNVPPGPYSIGSSVLGVPYLSRLVPEGLKFAEPSLVPGVPPRLQYCSGMETVLSLGLNAFGSMGSPWPQTSSYMYDVRWERFPYEVLDDFSTAALQSYCMGKAPVGTNQMALELFRYMIRSRKNTSREQPIPTGVAGFKLIDDSVPTNRQVIPGLVAQKVVSYADVMYTWCRIPRGWPPPIQWTPPAVTFPPGYPLWPPYVNPALSSPTSTLYARDKYIGTVNDQAFDTGSVRGYAFQPGELRYDGYDQTEYVDAAGDEVADVSYLFKYKKGGWNNCLNALGNLVGFSTDGTSFGTFMYQTSNFNNLFQYSVV